MVKSLTVCDSEDPNYAVLLNDYVLPVLECFPGTLDYLDLCSRFPAEATVANGLREWNLYENGISYYIVEDIYESTCLISIMVDPELPMPLN